MFVSIVEFGDSETVVLGEFPTLEEAKKKILEVIEEESVKIEETYENSNSDDFDNFPLYGESANYFVNLNNGFVVLFEDEDCWEEMPSW